MILPIRVRDELIGFVCLGAKASGDHYTGADLALLVADLSKQDQLEFGAELQQQRLDRHWPYED